MDYSKLPLLYPEGQQEEVSLCCGFVHQKRRETIESILDRISRLERAQGMKVNMLWARMEEKREEAIQCNKRKDLDAAKSHVRLYMQEDQKRKRLIAKRENLVGIYNALQTAYDNAVMAHTINDSNATLESLAAATPNLDDLMDRLRDNLNVVNDENEILAEPIKIEDDDVEMQLNDMIERRDEEEDLKLELPNVPQQKQHQNKKKMLVL